MAELVFNNKKFLIPDNIDPNKIINNKDIIIKEYKNIRYYEDRNYKQGECETNVYKFIKELDDWELNYFFPVRGIFIENGINIEHYWIYHKNRDQFIDLSYNPNADLFIGIPNYNINQEIKKSENIFEIEFLRTGIPEIYVSYIKENLIKLIKEEYNNLIKEQESNYQYFSIDLDFGNEELEDLGLDDIELSNQAYNIAKSSNIYILSDKDLKGIILDLNSNEVSGALWIGNNSNEFSFDIAVDPKHRNKRLSYILIDEALSEYDIMNDQYIDYTNKKKLPMNIDVVNPLLANILKNKYGFKVFKRISNDRVLMRK